jgi:hypothetical protein
MAIAINIIAMLNTVLASTIDPGCLSDSRRPSQNTIRLECSYPPMA